MGGVVAAIGAIASAVSSSAILSSIANIAMSFAGQMLLGGGKKKAPSFSPPADFARDRNVMVRQPITHREVVYGQTKKSGAIVYAETANNNKDLHLVVVLAGHEVEELGQVYLDGDPIELETKAEGELLSVTTGKYAGKCFIAKHLGSDTQTADATLAGLTGTSPYVGTLSADPVSTNQYQITPAGGAKQVLIDNFEVGDIIINLENNKEAELTGKSYNEAFQAWMFTATAASGVNFSASSFRYAKKNETSSLWTADHRLRGIAYVYAKFTWDSEVFDKIPDISVLIKGKKVYDPRTETTAYSANPSLCLLDYLTNTKYGLGAKTNELDLDSFVEAANVCDENIPLLSGGTEKRYECNGLIDTSKSPNDIIEDLLGSMFGTLSYASGFFRVKAGVYSQPVLSLDENDMTSPMKIATRTSYRDRFNTVKGVYVSPSHDWQASDFPPISVASYVSDDGDETIIKDIELNFTTSSSMAQRLARLQLERARREIVVDFTTTLKALKCIVGDTIELSNTRMGWVNKTFEVIEWSFSLPSDDEGNPLPQVRLKCQEIDSNVYNWIPGDELPTTPAPTTFLPNPFQAGSMGALTCESGTDQLFIKADGTVVSRIKVSWPPISDQFIISGGSIEIEFKKTSEAIYTKAPIYDASATYGYIFEVEDGQTYDVRARAVNYIGAKSAYSETQHTVIGKTTPPADVTLFNLIQQSSDLVSFTWSQVSDIDLAGYTIKYGIPGQVWENMTLLTQVQKGTSSTSALVPAGARLFAIKAVDTSGNESTNPLYIQATLFNDYTELELIDEDEYFYGTLDGFNQHYLGYLVPDSTIAAEDLTGIGLPEGDIPGVVSTSTYTTPEIDLGADATIRAWILVNKFLVGGGSGQSNVQTKLFWRKDGEEDSSAGERASLITEDGTFFNCVMHYNGKVIPLDSNATASYGWELFDKTVPNPISSCYYEAPEKDFGADISIGVMAEVTTANAVNNSTQGIIQHEIDYRTSSGAYDGFEVWASGTIQARYLKNRFTWNNTVGMKILSSAISDYDSFQPFSVGLITARYIKARIVVDNTVGNTIIDSIKLVAEEP